jgi:hypothetical protein
MSNDFHKEVVPFAVNLVNHFVSGYSVEELLKKYPSLHMGLEDC